MNKPEYVKVGEELYKINTDFRVALDCNNIASDESIGDIERPLAIIYKLFGEKGLDCEDKQKLIELGMKYITFGKDINSLKTNPSDKYELDFNKCKGLIKSSFKYDYKYDPYELEYLHWYDFYNDLENLSSSELGNCCALSRVLAVLNMDVSKVKNSKDRTNIIDAQKLLTQRYCKTKEQEISKEQEESAKEFYKQLGIEW